MIRLSPLSHSLTHSRPPLSSHTQIHTHTHTYTHTYKYYTHTSTPTNTSIHIHIHIPTHIHKTHPAYTPLTSQPSQPANTLSFLGHFSPHPINHHIDSRQQKHPLFIIYTTLCLSVSEPPPFPPPSTQAASQPSSPNCPCHPQEKCCDSVPTVTLAVSSYPSVDLLSAFLDDPPLLFGNSSSSLAHLFL